MPRIGDPLRFSSPLNSVLRDHLEPGEEASVLSDPHKDGREVDGDLYRMGEDGRATLGERHHLDRDLRSRDR